MANFIAAEVSWRQRSGRLLSFVVALGLLSACGRIGYDSLLTSTDGSLSDAPTSDMGTMVDAAVDAGQDAPLDAPINVDSSMDGGADAEADASPFADAGLDLGNDAEVDLGTTPGIVVSRESGLSTTETGGTDTFTLVLASAPSADVSISLTSSNTLEATVSPATLTFTSVDWATPQVITVTGIDDLAVDGDQAFTIQISPSTSLDGAYAGIDAADPTGVNHDDETPAIIVSFVSSLDTTEARGTGSFAVALQTLPASDVTVPLASDNPAEGTVFPVSLVFTPANWSVPQIVTVTGVDDDFVDGDVAYTVSVGPATGDATYAGLTGPNQMLINHDDDAASVVVTPLTLVTSETGSAATFTIELTSRPTSSVLFMLTSSDTTEGTVSPVSVSISSATWNTPRTITVTGVDDAIADGNVDYTVAVHVAAAADPLYAARPDQAVSAMNADDETAGITVSPMDGLVTTEIGGTATFTIRLNTQPTSDVNIALSSSLPSEATVSPSSIVITMGTWMTARTITVTGQDDFVYDGARALEIVTAPATSTDLSYSGFDAGDVAVTNLDNDMQGIVVTPTSGLATAETGTIATITMWLTSQPTADVVIPLSSSNAAEGALSVASLTFTAANWNTPQSFNVTGQNDSVVDGTRAYQIITGPAVSADPVYSGFNPSDVSLSNFDNDAANVIITPVAGLVTSEAGGTATFTATLTAAPSADVTITLTSTNTGEGTVSPSGFTFTSGNWNVPQTAIITGVNDLVFDNDVTYFILTSAASSADPTYNGLFVSDVVVTNRGASTYVKASNANSEDLFGYSVGVSSDGNTVVVGAPYEASAATGVGGNQSDNSLLYAGAAYVFVRVSGVWTQQAYIKASNPGTMDSFGNTVAISGDGNTLAVTSLVEASNSPGVGGDQSNNSLFGAGAVYVFTRSGVTWTQQAYIKASNPGPDQFGELLALSDDGSALLAGAHYEQSGASGVGANQADDSAPAAGAAYVFVRSGVTWSQQVYLKASNAEGSDHFAQAVALSGDGNTVAIGAPGESSNAVGIGGAQGNNLVPSSGAVYVFVRAAGVWTQQSYVKASNPNNGDAFGVSVALSLDGDALAVGAVGEASSATGVGGNQANNSAPVTGAVYAFTRSGTVWTQDAYIKASNAEANDYFGWSVSISLDGATLAVGAIGEDSAATGIGGSQSNNGVPTSGAVYIFARAAGVWAQSAYIKAPFNIAAGYFGLAIGLSGSGTTLVASSPYWGYGGSGINPPFGPASPNSGAIFIY